MLNQLCLLVMIFISIGCSTFKEQEQTRYLSESINTDLEKSPLIAKLSVNRDSMENDTVLVASLKIKNTKNSSICIPSVLLPSSNELYYPIFSININNNEIQFREFYGNKRIPEFRYIVIPPKVEFRRSYNLSNNYNITENNYQYSIKLDTIFVYCSILEEGLFDFRYSGVNQTYKEKVETNVKIIRDVEVALVSNEVSMSF